MALTVTIPMPGHEKTFSTKTAPAARAGSDSPTRVMVDSSAFLSAWRRTASRQLSPLARAVRIQSLGSTASSDDRWCRAMTALESTVSVRTGSTRCASRSSTRRQKGR
jgi:hypothetical protein